MSETLTPVFRLEYFITAAANGTPCDLEPIFNEEKYLHAIAGASVDLPMPVGRTQEYLAKLAGMDVEIPDHPIFRTEYYLAHMIDSTVECPAPIFREEMFYYEWASNEYVTVTGNPVSFTAKAAPLRKLEVAFSPVQSLNGYDAPWPAGGGKNLLDKSTASGTTTVWFMEPNGVLFKAGTTYYFSIGTAGEVSSLAIYGTDKTTQLAYASTGLTQAVTFTPESDVYGLPRMYKSGGVPQTAIDSAMLEIGSVRTAYAPYSNICPISGWSSLTVEQTGVNIFGGMAFAEALHAVSDVGEISGNTVTFGHAVPVGGNYARTLFSGFKPNTAYTIRFDYMAPNGKNNSLLVRYTDGGYVPITLEAASRTSYSLVVGPSRSVKDICLSFYSSYTTTLFIDTIGVMEGNNADFVPYNPSSRSISISIGQTVYSGYVDVISGVGEIDRTDIVFDGSSDENWSIYTFGTAEVKSFRIFVENMKNADVQDYIASEWLRNQRNGWANLAEWTISVAARYFYCRADSTIVTVDAWKAYLAEHPLKATYPLYTPIPISLTPQEVNSLAGDNVLFSDANGDLTVEYRSN